MPSYRNPNDLLWRDRNFNRITNVTWGWIATAISLAVILGVTFGIGK